MKLNNLVEGPQYKHLIYELIDVWTLEETNNSYLGFSNLRFIYNIN